MTCRYWEAAVSFGQLQVQTGERTPDKYWQSKSRTGQSMSLFVVIRRRGSRVVPSVCLRTRDNGLAASPNPLGIQVRPDLESDLEVVMSPAKTNVALPTTPVGRNGKRKEFPRSEMKQESFLWKKTIDGSRLQSLCEPAACHQMPKVHVRFGTFLTHSTGLKRQDHRHDGGCWRLELATRCDLF